MAYLFDLRRILMEMLPSAAMMEQAKVLCIQTQLEEIRRPLWAINAVILDAHLRVMALKEQALDDWMADIDATLVDLEDLLASIIDRQEREAKSGHSLSGSSAFLLPSRLAFRLTIRRKLKKMGRKLNSLVKVGESAFNLQREPMDSMDPLKDGYSKILMEDEMKGLRREEYEQIMEWLQQQQRDLQEEVEMHSTTKDEEYSSDDEIVEVNAPFRIIIQGAQGTGKRTLARMIYHDEWVRQHFHHRFWVDASNFYSQDVIGMGREIARSMEQHGNYNYMKEMLDKTSSSGFQGMWVFADQRLAGRRFLLILDGFDLFQDTDYTWDASEWVDKWNELNHILLRVGGPGSTIIITTTNWRQSGKFSLSLKDISKNDCIEVFIRATLVSQGPDQDKHKDRENMARTIATQLYDSTYWEVQMCNPLRAKMLGSIVRYTEISQWQEIVNDHGFGRIINEKQENLIELYLHPTRHVEKLLYYLLFSVDDIFPSEEYMHMMIAEGILPLWNDKDMLLGYMSMRGYEHLSQDVENQYCFTINLGNYSPMIPKQCRHLCLLFDSNASTTSFPALEQFERNKLRTLILRYSKEDIILKDPKCQIPTIPKAMFATLTYLRTLYLRASRVQHLLCMIGRLRNLRYLNLSHTEIDTFSKSLCNLQNLQILNLAHCQNLEKLSRQIHKLGRLQILKLAYCEKLQMLPATVTNLINLQELDLEGCPWLVQLPQGVSNLKRLVELNMHNCISLTQMPCRIGELTNLLRLSGYHANNEFGSALLELQSLINLKELRIKNLERAWGLDEIVGFFGLQKMTNLRYLTLCWQWWNMDDLKLSKSNMDNDFRIEVYLEASVEQYVQQLEDLQPYRPSLKKLEIISYAGNKWPSWMLDISAFESLIEIGLINLSMCQRIPPLEQLGSLTTTVISGMDSINTIDDFINNGTKIIFSEMPKLEKLSIRYNDDNEFEELKFIQCPKLKTIIFNFGFGKLTLWLNNEMMFTSESKGWDHLSCVGELEIVGSQELKFLPRGMKNLEYLRRLTIISCNNLISLPDWMGEAFHFLGYLEICNCPMLKSIPPIPHNIFLEQITIQGCPKLQLLDVSSFMYGHLSLQVTIEGCPKLQIIPRDVPSNVHLRIIK